MSADDRPAPGLLRALTIDGAPLDIRPAPVERDWMTATGERFAYRCLPLNIANAHGWEILCPVGFAVGWTGQPGPEAIVVKADGDAPAPAMGHFGSGIVTFHVPALIRTEPGYDLWVQGPVNRPKDGLYALSGVVETDWAPFTFTMNWMFTRPGIMTRFEQGEPFCHVFPIKRGDLERFEPDVRDLRTEPELEEGYRAWSASRNGFNADLKTEGSEAQAQRWQKNYYKGQDATGQSRGAEDHRTRMRLKPFRKG